MTKILVIDDRTDIRLSLTMLLEERGFEVVEASDGETAQQNVDFDLISLVLIDLSFTEHTRSANTALNFIRCLKSGFNSIPIIGMSAWSNSAVVNEALQLAIDEIIDKPWRCQQLLHIIDRQLEYQKLTIQNERMDKLLNIENNHYQWRSPKMLALFKKIAALKDKDVNVLLVGEQGTGKRQVAKQIHQQSTNSKKLFYTQPLANIDKQKIGFEDIGTLYLTAIAFAPEKQQQYLMHMLDENPADIRLISSSVCTSEELLKECGFIENLYYRLNTLEINIPPLRERITDIVPLAQFFVEQFCNKYHCSIKKITEQGQLQLKQYLWPGNITELAQVIERSVLLSNEEELTLIGLSPENTSGEIPLMTIEEAEIALVKKAMKQTENNVSKAAALVGLTKASMYRRLEKYAINKK